MISFSHGHLTSFNLVTSCVPRSYILINHPHPLQLEVTVPNFSLLGLVFWVLSKCLCSCYCLSLVHKNVPLDHFWVSLLFHHHMFLFVLCRVSAETQESLEEVQTTPKGEARHGGVAGLIVDLLRGCATISVEVQWLFLTEISGSCMSHSSRSGCVDFLSLTSSRTHSHKSGLHFIDFSVCLETGFVWQAFFAWCVNSEL